MRRSDIVHSILPVRARPSSTNYHAWGVMDLDFLPNAPGFLWLKRLIECGEVMRIQIVHDEDNFLSVWIVDIGEIPQHLGQVVFGTMDTHRHMLPAAQRLKAHEEATDTLPLILVVIALHLAGFRPDGHPCFAHQLLAGLIQAHLGSFWVIRTLVHFQHLLLLQTKAAFAFGGIQYCSLC